MTRKEILIERYKMLRDLIESINSDYEKIISKHDNMIDLFYGCIRIIDKIKDTEE